MRQPPGLGQTRRPSPVVDESLDAQCGEACVVLPDEIQRLTLAHGDVGDLAHGRVLTHRVHILRWMDILHPGAVGSVSVAQAKLGAKIVANENELVERSIVADQPRRDAGEENSRGYSPPLKRWLVLFRAPIPRP